MSRDGEYGNQEFLCVRARLRGRDAGRSVEGVEPDGHRMRRGEQGANSALVSRPQRVDEVVEERRVAHLAGGVARTLRGEQGRRPTHDVVEGMARHADLAADAVIRRREEDCRVDHELGARRIGVADRTRAAQRRCAVVEHVPIPRDAAQRPRVEHGVRIEAPGIVVADLVVAREHGARRDLVAGARAVRDGEEDVLRDRGADGFRVFLRLLHDVVADGEERALTDVAEPVLEAVRAAHGGRPSRAHATRGAPVRAAGMLRRT